MVVYKSYILDTHKLFSLCNFLPSQLLWSEWYKHLSLFDFSNCYTQYVALIFVWLWNIDYIACVALRLLGAMADLLTNQTIGFCWALMQLKIPLSMLAREWLLTNQCKHGGQNQSYGLTCFSKNHIIIIFADTVYENKKQRVSKSS